MGQGDQAIQIHTSLVILGQNNAMVCRQSLNNIRTGFAKGVQACKILNSLFLQHRQKSDKDLRSGSCIIYCSMMTQQRNVQCFRHSVQGMLCLIGQKNPGNSHRVHISELVRVLQSSAVLHNKAHIKFGIMGNQYGIFTEFQKLRQDHFNGWAVHNHIIANRR